MSRDHEIRRAPPAQEHQVGYQNKKFYTNILVQK